MADFTTPFGDASVKRVPTAAEASGGFACGAAKRDLFNGLFHRIESELGAVIAEAGLTPSDADFGQVVEAILDLIAAHVLVDSQIPARLRATANLVTDWDDATENGWYRAANGATNAPDTGQFIGYVEALTATYCTQTVHGVVTDDESDTKVWRRGNDNGTWSDWYQLRLSVDEQDAAIAAAVAGKITEAEADLLYIAIGGDLPAGNLTGAVSTARLPMASEAEAEDGTLLARVMSPLRDKAAFFHHLSNLGPDDIGSRMYCGYNGDTFAVGDSFAGTSLHPSSARNSSALAAGAATGGSSASFELGTATLTGTWEALTPSEGGGSNITRWAFFQKVSDV
jgi:hypothetical protein